MKNLMKDFCLRGLIFGAGGPLVYAIIMIILYICNVDTKSDGLMIFKAIFSTYLMAFLIAGISVIWKQERFSLATLICFHAIVLYMCYLLTYLINGWIQVGLIEIGIFTVFFILGYLIVWIIIYVCDRKRVKKLNEILKK